MRIYSLSRLRNQLIHLFAGHDHRLRSLICTKVSTVDFVRKFVTMDETTWVHHFMPESKQQSVQWTEAGYPAPTKANSVSSAGKVLASVFWDAKGILLIDYLNKCKTITREHYVNLLDRLDEKILEKRPCLQNKKSFSIKTMRLCTKVLLQWEN